MCQIKIFIKFNFVLSFYHLFTEGDEKWWCTKELMISISAKISVVGWHRYNLFQWNNTSYSVVSFPTFSHYTPHNQLARAQYHFDDLAQDCSNSIANALQLLQSCAKPLMYLSWIQSVIHVLRLPYYYESTLSNDTHKNFIYFFSGIFEGCSSAPQKCINKPSCAVQLYLLQTSHCVCTRRLMHSIMEILMVAFTSYYMKHSRWYFVVHWQLKIWIHYGNATCMLLDIIHVVL